jgi:hypothetical protein
MIDYASVVQYLMLVVSFTRTEHNAQYPCNRMKNNKYHTVRTVRKYSCKIVERGKWNIIQKNTQIRERSHFWLGTGTVVKK